MSDSGLTSEIVLTVAKAHGLTTETDAKGMTIFARSGFDPIPIRLPSGIGAVTKALVRRISRGFRIPIDHFYNAERCSDACRFAAANDH